MKNLLKIAAQVGALCGTAWLLIATSPARECIAQGPITFSVTGTCGPEDEITVSNDGVCSLRIDNAQSVNLPSEGFVMGSGTGILDADWRLNAIQRPLVVPNLAHVPDGGSLDAGVEGEADAGLAPDGGESTDGGGPQPGENYKPDAAFDRCDVLLTAQGTFDLECFEVATSSVVCSGKLVQTR